MSAGKLDIYIEQGATFQAQLIWKDALEALIDLSGYTARLQIRPKIASDILYIDLNTENNGIVLGGAAGTIDMSIAAVVTEAITWLRAKYDLELIDGSGFVTRLVEGDVTISFNVTKPIITEVLAPYMNQSYWEGTNINWNGTIWTKDDGGISILTEANDWNIGFRPASINIDYTITVESGSGTVFDIQTSAGVSLGSLIADDPVGSYSINIPLTFTTIDLYKLVIGDTGYNDELTIENITFSLT